MSYEFDPNRPPQSSGMTDVQVVEALTNHLSRIERQVIEQPSLVRKEISAALKEYATVVDKIMEGRLRSLHTDLHATLVRYQNDNKADVALLNSRIDTAFNEIDALGSRVVDTTEEAILLAGTSPTIRAAARKWLHDELRSVRRAIAVLVVLVVFLIVVQAIWFWMGING